jgi:CheY-like chemotaxis protein
MKSVQISSKQPVLLIEDDREIRSALSDLLAEDGYAVDTAENGQRALDYLGHSMYLPCLILLDVMMPVMDGYAFRAEQIKNPHWAKIPTVMITADGHIQTKAQNMGLKDYLPKPIDFDQLLDLTSRYCVRQSFKPL